MEIKIISAFSPEENDGGGWATRKIFSTMFSEGDSRFTIRRSSFLTKLLYGIMGIVLLPFIHPIFTRFLPICAIKTYIKEPLILNFSQTFGTVIINRESTLICHDLQCHRAHFFKRWVRSSERFLLRRAARIVVLTHRDLKTVVRLYGIDRKRVSCVSHHLLKDIPHIKRTLPQEGPLRLVFLGSLSRVENVHGLHWFVNNVIDGNKNILLDVIGFVEPSRQILHPRIFYKGFVDDLAAELKSYDLSIAPMFVPAGIKIKVIECLSFGIPVLGTKSAYGGLGRPNYEYCNDSPSIWLATLRTRPTFIYNMKNIEH